MKLIGLGHTGCEIVKILHSYGVYESFFFDSERRDLENFFLLDEEDNSEDYESNFPEKTFFNFENNEEVVLVLSTSGFISSSVLVLLEQITHCQITIVAIIPDLSTLDKMHILQHNLISQVLQEYARSGKFKEIIFFSNNDIEKTISEISFIDYYEKINNTISSALYGLHYFEKCSPVFGKTGSPETVSRISSIGMKDIRDGAEIWYFNLNQPRNVIYYYGLNSIDINSKEMRYEILKKMRDKKQQSVLDFSSSYGIYLLTGQTSYCYMIARTNVIQNIQ